MVKSNYKGYLKRELERLKYECNSLVDNELCQDRPCRRCNINSKYKNLLGVGFDEVAKIEG